MVRKTRPVPLSLFIVQVLVSDVFHLHSNLNCFYFRREKNISLEVYPVWISVCPSCSRSSRHLALVLLYVLLKNTLSGFLTLICYCCSKFTVCLQYITSVHLGSHAVLVACV